MKYLIRTDSSFDIGTGHVMRCLTLADSLRKIGHEITFICRNLPGNISQIIENSGFDCIMLKYYDTMLRKKGKEQSIAHEHWLCVSWIQDAQETYDFLCKDKYDWVIVDHYALDYRFEKLIRQCCQKLMVIDDLEDRRHVCDLLLDFTVTAKKNRYKNLVPENCQLFLGSQYALLRDEFTNQQHHSLRRRKNIKLESILVSMGGIDADNYTLGVLQEIERSDNRHTYKITVIVGANYPHLEILYAYIKISAIVVTIKQQVSNIAEIICENDIAICSLGVSALERACLGIPSINIPIAENQIETAIYLENIGAGLHRRLDQVATTLNSLNKNQLRSLSMNSQNLTDGKGARFMAEQLHKPTVCFFGSNYLLLEQLENLVDIKRIVIEVRMINRDIKTYAHLKEIPITVVNNLEELEQIVVHEELGVSNGFGLIFRQESISQFTKGIINIHFGTLPDIRSRHPVSWAFLLNNNKVGISIHLIDENIDRGYLLHQFTVKRSLNDTLTDIDNKIIAALSQQFPYALNALNTKEYLKLSEGYYYENLSGMLNSLVPEDHTASYIINAVRSQHVYGGIVINGEKILECYIYDENYHDDSFHTITSKNGITLMVRGK